MIDPFYPFLILKKPNHKDHFNKDLKNFSTLISRESPKPVKQDIVVMDFVSRILVSVSQYSGVWIRLNENAIQR